MSQFSVLEICAGAGGQAIGLEAAGWHHAAVVDNDPDACTTLRRNRSSWHVIEDDVAALDGKAFRGIDLLAGGVPCPPFSIAGDQLGEDDERDLFPEALRLIGESRPAAVMLENVKGFATRRFERYRSWLLGELARLGYKPEWRLLTASNFGVAQLRPRFVLIALRPEYADRFSWPESTVEVPTVGEALEDLMAAGGWRGAAAWAKGADAIAPTIVGGSKKHGGPDLGPTRARRAWRTLGVDGLGLADAPPPPDHSPEILPRLTVRMVARLQGFPDDWIISGSKTAAHRQVGNAFPPPVARAVSAAIRAALTSVVPEPCTGQLPGAKPERIQYRLFEESGAHDNVHA